MKITILGMLALPCFTAAFFQKRPGETIGFSLGLMMALLYLFYIMNCLQIGVYVLIALILGCYLFAIPKFLMTAKREGISTMSMFFSPGLFVFVLASIFIRFVTRGNVSLFWDELRLWSAVPKALFLTNELQLGPGALIYSSMQNYLPGIGLIEFFFQSLNGHYYDDLTFAVYGCVGASFLLPVAERIDKKRWWMILAYALMVFLCPVMFYNNPNGADSAVYYQTLFIDGLLGLAFSYSLYCTWKCSDASWFSLLRYAVSISTLMLLKESGILLSVFSLIFWVLIYNKKLIATTPPRYIITIGLCLFAIVSIKSSWAYLLTYYQVDATGSWVSLSGIISTILTPNEAELEIWRSFFKMLCTTTLIGKQAIPFFPPTWISFITIYIAFGIVLVRITKRKELSVLLSLGLLAELLYTASMIFLFQYWGAFHSYERYMNTGMLALYSFLMVIIVEVFLSNTEKSKRLSIFMLGFIVLFSGYFEIKPQKIHLFVNDVYNLQHSVVEEIDYIIKSDYKGSDNVISIFLINEGDVDHVLDHHQVYNQLLNYGIAVRNWCYDTSLDSKESDHEGHLYHKLKFSNATPYEYLYVTDKEVNQGYLYHKYANQFEGGADAICSGGVYRIEYDDINHDVQFVLCGNAF